MVVKHPGVIRAAHNGRGTGMTQMTSIAPDKILQLGSAFWGSKTLLSAIELGLFTHLAQRGPLSLAEVREGLSLHERSARASWTRSWRSACCSGSRTDATPTPPKPSSIST